MLLALHEMVFHLPVTLYGRFALLQYKIPDKKESLNQSSIDFYVAFDNTGPIRGVLDYETNQLLLFTSFYKTANFLKDELKKLSYDCKIEIRQEIVPLWKGDKALLDLKG